MAILRGKHLLRKHTAGISSVYLVSFHQRLTVGSYIRRYYFLLSPTDAAGKSAVHCRYLEGKFCSSIGPGESAAIGRSCPFRKQKRRNHSRDVVEAYTLVFFLESTIRLVCEIL